MVLTDPKILKPSECEFDPLSEQAEQALTQLLEGSTTALQRSKNNGPSRVLVPT